MKTKIKTISMIFFLTVFTFIETTDFTTFSYERFPYAFLGCLTTVIVKFFIIPTILKLKNKDPDITDEHNQNKKDN